MEIEKNTLARVYSFDLQFKGGKRTKFYRKLFGFKSKTTKEDKNGREKVYENFYPGVITPLPHLRLGKSVIAIPKSAQNSLDNFFNDPIWKNIDLYSFDGILPSEDRIKAMEKALGRIDVGREESLDSEIDSLLSIESRDKVENEEIQRIRKVVEKCKDLMSHDWTDNKEFSKNLKERIRPLREKIS